MKVLVLGAGVTGVTTAYYLRQQGFSVTVVDRQPGVGLETSFANAGQISPGYATPWAAPGIPLRAMRWLMQRHAPLAIRLTPDWRQYQWLWLALRNCTAARYAVNKERMLRLAEYSRDCLDELRHVTGIGYDDRQLGTTQVFRSQQQLDAAAEDMRLLAESSVPHRLLKPEEIHEFEPALHAVRHQLTGALHLPNDQTGDCYLFTCRLAELAQAAGVEFRFNSTVGELSGAGDRLLGVKVDGALERADHYVLALGTSSRRLLNGLGLDVPLYPLKGYSLTYGIRNESAAPASTVLDETWKVALTRLGGRVRVGGMAELAGNDLGLNPRRRETLEMVVNSLFPQAGDSSTAAFWAGLRHAMPDSVPVLGGTAYANLSLNIGHTTLGWTMACGAAQYLADQLAGKTPKISSEGLDIFRYAGRF